MSFDGVVQMVTFLLIVLFLWVGAAGDRRRVDDPAHSSRSLLVALAWSDHLPTVDVDGS
jgi:hypothetical protein